MEACNRSRSSTTRSSVALLIGAFACLAGSQSHAQNAGTVRRVDMHAAASADLDAAFVWRSIFVSAEPASQGEKPASVASLNPADPSRPPLIWHQSSDRVVAVQSPSSAGVAASGATPGTRQLGVFSGGLAAAEAATRPYLAADGKTTRTTLWGFVDTEGRWVLPPTFERASAFVGDVAMVLRRKATPGGELKLIDRQGHVLEWTGEPLDFRGIDFDQSAAAMERAGRWTLIRQPGSNISLDAEGRVNGAPSDLSDGRRVIRPPGVEAQHSADGALWIVATVLGNRLWRPETGLIELPAGVTPLMPLSADRFLGEMRGGSADALYAVTGSRLLEHSQILVALAHDRFLACLGPVASPSSGDARARVFETGSEQLSQRCGIRDETGRWWAPPTARQVQAWTEHEVLLQGDQPCLLDLRAKVPACARLARPLPRLQSRPGLPAFRYVDGSGGTAWSTDYTQAMPFAGAVAEVGIDDVPGLVDAAGALLTPKLEGTPFEKARARTSLGSFAVPKPIAAGLIDRGGRWIVPPVYGQMLWQKDGSLIACGGIWQPKDLASCDHLSRSGALLAPAVPDLDPEANGARPDVLVPPVSGTGPSAVAVNDRWGYRNAAGTWTIRPRFADAEDFDGDRAFAAIDVPVPEGQGEPGTTVLRWGVIAPSGAWVAEPRFDAVRPFREGVAVVRSGQRYGLVDRQGTWVAQPEFTEIGAFANGAARALREKDGWCLLQSSGACVGPGRIGVLTRGADRWAVATVGNVRPGFTGYLDMRGAWAIEPRFDFATPFNGDAAIVSATLADADEAAAARWVVTRVDRRLASGLIVVSAMHPRVLPGSQRLNGVPDERQRMALADDAGRWLLPRSGP